MLWSTGVTVHLLYAAVVCAEASAVHVVSGHVGAEVSIHCSGSWTTNNSSERHNMYFCRGLCSRENILIQAASESMDVTRQGRYSMEVDKEDGTFSMTIKRLRRTDAGPYQCGVEGNLHVWHQEVTLIVVDESTVPLGSSPATTPIQAGADAELPLPRGSSASGTAPSPAASTLPAAEDKTNQTATTYLKDTTVVIIVSVSLGVLVCAIIPLIFYRHWWSNAGEVTRTHLHTNCFHSLCDLKPKKSIHMCLNESCCLFVSEGQNKGQPENCEENADVASTQAAASLQPLDAEPESSIHNSSQYAGVYQALNPKTLD
ncbi:CMRF35-like molecule 8 isoform X1 [Clinocottus analis]|uniref:CMRF35-like molecule 8 isoform X1 n=1 Tax=Clinocottus analis TaxID=304258 RepID=UPI0035BF3913